MKKLNKENLTSPDLLSHSEIEQLLPHLDDFVRWAKQVQDYALGQALQGEKYEGFKLVAGRSNRTLSDEDKVVDTLLGAGYEESLIFERKLATLTKLESLLGKKKFEVLLGDLVIKPIGKPTLVPEEDGRPTYSLPTSAAEDFAD